MATTSIQVLLPLLCHTAGTVPDVLTQQYGEYASCHQHAGLAWCSSEGCALQIHLHRRMHQGCTL